VRDARDPSSSRAADHRVTFTVVRRIVPPPPHSPQATFRTGVDLIQIDVVVLDQNR